MIKSQKKIILFDGVCNLCNNTVNYIIQKDKREVFQFAALQSEIGQELCRERHIDTDKIDSIVLIDPGKAYYFKSQAAVEISKHLNGLRWLGVLGSLVPTSLGDFFYDLIAKNRYAWFGKKDNCMVPTPELKKRFL